MPIYDLYCKKCDHITEDYFCKPEDPLPNCHLCGGKTARICNCRSFKLLYDPKKDSCTWGNEGYKESQYWKEYKKAKAEGRNVKPAGAD